MAFTYHPTKVNLQHSTRAHLAAARQMPNKKTAQFKRERAKIAAYYKARRKVDGPNSTRRRHHEAPVTSGLEAGRRLKQLT